jgi:murein L,D-transpeptidase YafK
MRTDAALSGAFAICLFSASLFACKHSSMPDSFASKPLAGIDKSQVSILIDKSDFTLTLLLKGEPLKTYPMVLGFNPSDDKRREGDGCTPEGHFSIRKQYPHAKWNFFIWVDYPTDESWVKHKQAKEEGKIPIDATIGGEIGIHGVPDGNDALIDTKMNWTLGCISLKNADIAEIYNCVQEGTPIEIRK